MSPFPDLRARPGDGCGARVLPSSGLGRPIAEGSPWPAFRAYCRSRARRLEPILRVGRTQTCVVDRCTALLPALAALPRVAARRGRLALLEIGPSAGLNLRLDRYRYDCGDGLVWGEPTATPVLACETRGRAKPPLPERLEVAARPGIDLNLLEVADPATVRWLRALIWPEHVARVRASFLRLRSSYQIPPEGRRALVEGIARTSRGRPLDLLLLESSGEGDSRLEWHGFESGARSMRRTLARCDSHGRWIDWGAS